MNRKIFRKLWPVLALILGGVFISLPSTVDAQDPEDDIGAQAAIGSSFTRDASARAVRRLMVHVHPLLLAFIIN